MLNKRWILSPTIALVLLAGCDSDDEVTPFEPPDVPEVQADPIAGSVAFVKECAFCHASGDGLDLAFFSFTDTTILRRALGHVDSTTAFDIIAHINDMPVSPVSRDERIFQPGHVVLESDLAFALELFGEDAWPASLSRVSLLARDPLQVRVAVPLPLWSVEEENIDWMPDQALPDYILDDRGSLGRALLAGYRAAPTRSNLIRLVNTLRTAANRPEAGNAPCPSDAQMTRFQECFQIQRWTATLGAQHMLREGSSTSIHPTVHDAWWDVGQTARRSVIFSDGAIENGIENWVSWMYVGWIFHPERHASTYTAGGLANFGLPRHATFVTLRSLVARPQGAFSVYPDLSTAARHTPAPWAFTAMRFAYTEVLRRLDAGERPPQEQLEEVERHLTNSINLAGRKVTEAQRAELLVMVLEIAARVL